MEDSAEFLKMAGSIMLFVIALSIILPLYSQARQTIDSLIAYSDRESEFYNGYAYLDGTAGEDKYFYNGKESDKDDPANRVRKVGLDSIIPAIYRSYDENYRIIFMIGEVPNIGESGSKEFFENLYPYNFYQKQVKNKVTKAIEWVPSNVFDLNGFSIPKENVNEFIEAFLYGKFKQYAGYGSNPQNGFQSYYNIKFDQDLSNNAWSSLSPSTVSRNIIKQPPSGAENKVGQGLYHALTKHLENNIILEYMGIYYLEDVELLENLDLNHPNSIPANEDNVPESMKDEKRVITYVLKTN